jgi:Predicted oxidoreductases (related to aryl-alcohol dehydrogenases)
METVKLEKTDLLVSRLCMGGCPMGQYGWGATDKQALIQTVQGALASGINFFDTADVYGMGESERTLGEALGKKRKNAVVATKFGVRVGQAYDNSPKWMEAALAQSLKNLNTDYIDLYQIHYLDDVTPMEDIVAALVRAREKGYIRFFGLSNVFEKDIARIAPFKDYFVSVQDEYSLAKRENEQDLLDLTHSLGLTPMTWGSLGQGILTGKYDETAAFEKDDRRSREVYVNFHGEKLKKNLEIVGVMKDISARIGKPVSAIAIRFILNQLKNSVVLAGMKNKSQLEGNLTALNWQLETEDFAALDAVSR